MYIFVVRAMNTTLIVSYVWRDDNISAAMNFVNFDRDHY